MSQFKTTLREEQGFTLIELLVVILIIGILAAIALPNFISQRNRAFDVTSKSDVRNTLTHVEACYTTSMDYRQCTTSADLGSGLGISIGTGTGQVDIASTSKDAYEITGRSKTGSIFRITKTTGDWRVTRSCTVAPGLGDSGCPNGSW